MPFVDKYDTQSAIELMRQSVDYHGWFDKARTCLWTLTRAGSGQAGSELPMQGMHLVPANVL